MELIYSFAGGFGAGIVASYYFLRSKYPQVIQAIQASVAAAEKAAVQKAVDAITKV